MRRAGCDGALASGWASKLFGHTRHAAGTQPPRWWHPLPHTPGGVSAPIRVCTLHIIEIMLYMRRGSAGPGRRRQWCMEGAVRVEKAVAVEGPRH
jgi:hypothetical protein